MPPDGPERDRDSAGGASSTKTKRSRSELEEELEIMKTKYKTMQNEIQNVIACEMKTVRPAFHVGTSVKRLKALGCTVHATIEMRDGTKYDLTTRV